MKDKDDILIRIFRNRLKNCEQPVRDELWASIEKDIKPVIVHKPRIQTLWRYAGIAASFLLILGMGIFFYQNDRGIESQLVETDSEKTIKQPFQIPQKSEDVLAASPDESIEEKQSLFSFPKGSVKESKHIAEVLTEKQNGADQQDDSFQEKDEKGRDQQETQYAQAAQSSPLIKSINTNNDLWNYPSRNKKKNNRTFALAFGGQSMNSTSNKYSNLRASHVYGDFNFQNFGEENFDSFEYLTSVSKDELEPYDYDFEMPISVGLTVRKHFSDAFAVESGLIYTYLASQEKTAYTISLVNNIHLHYLGIPVRMVYSFHNTDRLSLYALGGGMVEKSVYGKSRMEGQSSSEKLNVRELQWSVSGALGVNYRLVDHLGIFIEPGISYYFDDNSDVMTIRKDMPLNFTLQGGLRLTY